MANELMTPYNVHREEVMYIGILASCNIFWEVIDDR